MSERDYLKLEQAEAIRDGADIVKNSGRGLFKCDATLGDFGIDYKMAERSFALTPSKWSKIVSDAWRNGSRTAALKIVFLDGLKLRLWIIDDFTMHDYLRLRKLEKDGEI